MFSLIDGWLLAVSIVVIGALFPGPCFIYLINKSLGSNSSSGLWAAMGIATGIFIHSMVIAFVFSRLLEVSPLFYTILKWIGALYLISLGISSFYSKKESNEGLEREATCSSKKTYFEALFINLLNPNVLIFLMALLPQYIDSGLGNLQVQFLKIASYVVLVHLLTHLSVALAVRFIKVKDKFYATFQKYVIPPLFTLLAVKLII